MTLFRESLPHQFQKRLGFLRHPLALKLINAGDVSFDEHPPRGRRVDAFVMLLRQLHRLLAFAQPEQPREFGLGAQARAPGLRAFAAAGCIGVLLIRPQWIDGSDSS